MGPKRTENWNGLSTTHAVSRSVRDNALLMDLTHGREAGSRYDAPAPEGSFLTAATRDPRPLKIAVWPIAPNGTRPHPEAVKGLVATTDLLAGLGHIVEEASPTLDGDALGKGMFANVAAHTAAWADERAAVLDRDLTDEDLEDVTLRLAELGRAMPMSELVHATNSFIEAAIAYDHFLIENGYDMILAPTLSMPPVELGRLSLSPDDVDAYTELVTAFAPHCALFNQIGAPAMSVPLHWTDDNLPLGMMFGARLGQEDILYSLAGQLERAQPWAHRRPPVWVGDLEA